MKTMAAPLNPCLDRAIARDAAACSKELAGTVRETHAKPPGGTGAVSVADRFAEADNEASRVKNLRVGFVEQKCLHRRLLKIPDQDT